MKQRRPIWSMRLCSGLLSMVGLLTIGCSGEGDLAPPALPLGALTVQKIDFSGGPVPMARVQQVAETIEDVGLYTDQGLMLYSSGSSLASDGSVRRWRDAQTIPAQGIEGSWLVGVDDEGKLWRIKGQSALEDVTARLGLSGKAILGVRRLGASDPMGPVLVAYVLEGKVAVSDGSKLTYFEVGLQEAARTGRLTGQNARLAGATDAEVTIVDLGTNTRSSHKLGGTVALAYDAEGALWAATPSALHVLTDGRFVAVHEVAEGAVISGLVATPRGLYVRIDESLWLVRGGTAHELSLPSAQPLRVPKDASMKGSPTGDLWLFGGAEGGVVRYGEAEGGGMDLVLWREKMQPVFRRLCQSCHLPAGSARIDLSTYGAWHKGRAALRQRVVDRKPSPMPPVANGMLSELELTLMRDWTQRSQ